VEEEEHLAIVSQNSCLEKGGQLLMLFWSISLRKLVLTDQFYAKLYNLWRVFQRKRSVLQDRSLYVMVSIVERDFFFT